MAYARYFDTDLSKGYDGGEEFGWMEMGLGDVIHILGSKQGKGMSAVEIFSEVKSKTATMKDLEKHLSLMYNLGDVKTTADGRRYALTDNAQEYSEDFIRRRAQDC